MASQVAQSRALTKVRDAGAGPALTTKQITMAQQTAVEWLVQKYFNDYNVLIPELEYEQAKQMDKEQQLELIRFIRMQDKMGKSVEDLYNQFVEVYGE